MLKRLGMIVVSIVCAALFAFVLPVLFTAWAAEATLYTCNSGAGVE